MKQSTRSKAPREDRDFDTTSLRAAGHGRSVHRDYAAHFFRWGFAKRFIRPTDEVLEVGCGPDFPLVYVLGLAVHAYPKKYVGVDLNPLTKTPSRTWATYHGSFNFIERHRELKTFDVIVNFEVIEHMGKEDGDRLLVAMREHLKPKGKLLLSTPVFNGRAARNHIHEWTIPELSESIARAGLVVENRFGTFASYTDLKRVASRQHLDVLNAIMEYYDGDVGACFLAPLYPDHSRNNIWILRRK